MSKEMILKIVDPDRIAVPATKAIGSTSEPPSSTTTVERLARAFNGRVDAAGNMLCGCGGTVLVSNVGRLFCARCAAVEPEA